MIDSIEKLRGEIQILSGNNIDTDELAMIADAIEREVEERYIEGPTDKNGDPITYSTKTYQWGALEYIACEMYPDGTYEWFVRGHDISAPLEKAKHVTVAKPPTVEDVLWEFGRGWHEQMNGPETFDIADYVERYAAKFQLKEAE